ncbi:MAG: IPT/TIG domain-containing protein [Candidatus Liptonbacteria bacterium]|nr:IPT/TIG domain-containing protein [Candidatus Liptonbacteria bacterium]
MGFLGDVIGKIAAVLMAPVVFIGGLFSSPPPPAATPTATSSSVAKAQASTSLSIQSSSLPAIDDAPFPLLFFEPIASALEPLVPTSTPTSTFAETASAVAETFSAALEATSTLPTKQANAPASSSVAVPPPSSEPPAPTSTMAIAGATSTPASSTIAFATSTATSSPISTASSSATSTPPTVSTSTNPRVFTIRGQNFCTNNPGSSAIFIRGYPLINDISVPPILITSWSDTQVTFETPDSVPRGSYAVIVRGYRDTEPRGYCTDVTSSSFKIAVP